MGTRSKSVGRDASLWLVLGAALLAVVLVAHGPTHADLGRQMENISDSNGQWAVVHWFATGALLLLTGAGFMFFAETVAGRGTGAPVGAWLVLAIGSLVTIGTAVSEATAITRAAETGDLEAFVIWWEFAGGLGNGFLAVGLATAVIAWTAASSPTPPIPVWACRFGALFGLLSAIGWSLGQHFRVDIGGPIWFVSTLLVCLWLVVFGFGLRRSQ